MYENGLCLRGGAENAQQIYTLAFFQLAVLVAAQFLLYAVQGAALDCFTGSLHFDDMKFGMLFPLLTPLNKVMYHFRLFKIAEGIRTDLVQLVFVLHWTAEID